MSRPVLHTMFGPVVGVGAWVPAAGAFEGAAFGMFGVDRSPTPFPRKRMRCDTGESCEHYTWQDPRAAGCSDAVPGGKACS